MKRLIIDKFADNHVFVEQQALISNRRITGDKRKQTLERQTWQRIGRTIYRGGVLQGMPAEFGTGGIEVLPMGSPEIEAIARENGDTAFVGALHADATVAAIEHQLAIADADVKPHKRLRVVFVDEDDPTAMAFANQISQTVAE